MDEQTALALGVAAFVGFFIILLVVTSRFKKRRLQAFQAFADEHGLEVDEGRFPMLRGELEGHSFIMGVEPLRYAVSGERKRGAAGNIAQLVVRLELNGSLPENLVVVKRGLIEKAMTSDVDTGDREFDSKALVRCANPAAAKAYLTPDRRAALLRLLPKKISLQEGCLVFGPASGKLSTREHLDQTSKPFRDAASILDAPIDAPLAVPVHPESIVGADGEVARSAAMAQGPRHAIAAGWMAATALVVQYLPSMFSGYFEFWFSMNVIVTVLAMAGVAYGASKWFESRIAGDTARGVAIGVVSWLLGSLIASFFSWGPGEQIASWFSMYGVIRVVLSGISGAGMAFVLRRRSR